MITLNATHQQTKRLVDTVNGTYQTVLTIDPSVGWSDIVGTYNCIVENDRGESSETVVIPGEPCSCTLHTKCINGIFLKLSWMSIAYSSHYKGVNTICCYWISKHIEKEALRNHCMLIRESVDSVCRNGTDTQYMRYLSQSNIT